MSIPTTPLKFPLDGKPVDKDGNWTPTWHRAMQGLFTRTGANVAPSNIQLANAIATNVVGSGASTDGHVAVYSGTTGLTIHDTGIAAASLVAGPASATASDIALFDGATGKLIKDSGTQLSSLATTAAIAQLITGPATSVVGNVAVFNNTTGTLAADSGTVTPKAPTAAPGTNTTQVATTAFVTTAVAAAGTTASNFSAHNNGTAQSIPNNAFTKLTLGTTEFNTGSNYSTANSRWTPPANRPVMLTGQMGIGTTLNTLTIVSIYKNGAEFKRGVQMPAGGTNSGAAVVTCIDIPNGTDYYELWGFQNTGGAVNTVSSSAITWFQGTSIQA